MYYSIKDLISQWFSKNFIYEAIKQSLPLSKQFEKNKRFFDEKDLEILIFYKQFGFEKTVLKYWKSDKQKEKVIDNETVYKTIGTVSKNSFETRSTDVEKIIKNEIETIKEQFKNREEELTEEILQKEQIIKIKDEQTQKYALLKQEEKKEKDEWIKKYDSLQKEKNERITNFYNIKIYMLIFLILFIITMIWMIIFLLQNSTKTV